MSAHNVGAFAGQLVFQNVLSVAQLRVSCLRGTYLAVGANKSIVLCQMLDALDGLFVRHGA